MKKVTDDKIINYLHKRGIFPVKENERGVYYAESQKLNQLLESYYIESVCFYNWKPRYK
jgi:hypothetical protein